MKKIRCNYGHVYLFDEYVMKYIHKQFCSTFIMEVWVASQTSCHPHLSHVTDVSLEGNFLVMNQPRYVETLNHTMNENWLHIMWDVVSGLVYLHNALHVIHYDIKIDNICRTDDHRAVLIDFGHARLASHNSLWHEEYHIRYRPPEIEETSGIVVRHYTSDIWALGILWLECILQREVLSIFGVLYSHYKPGWWRFRQLKSIFKKDQAHLSYEQTYFHLTRDRKEVYLRYLDLYMKQDRTWLYIIRPMLRHNPTLRATSMDTYCNILAHHRSTFKTHSIPHQHMIPPLITNSPKMLKVPEVKTKEDTCASQLIGNVLQRQGRYICAFPEVTVAMLKAQL